MAHILSQLNLRILSCISALLMTGYSQAQNQPTPVITSKAEIQDYTDVVEALGTLKANHSVTITSAVTELITAVHLSDDQQVKAGDLLISMDSSSEQALLQEEQARLGEAQRLVERLSPLTAQNATSKSALDAQKSIVSVSEARIKGIRSQIEKRQIRAPFDGVIGLLDISVGTLAQPGIELATLDDINVMKMDFSVPERHLAALQKGVKIEATTQAYPDEVFSGEIAFVDTRINPNTRAVLVRAIIQNEQQLLKPGLLMRIKLMTQPRQALMIPEEAVTSSGNNQSVFVVDNSKPLTTVKKVMIKQGNRKWGEVEVLQGLSAGDEVVVHGTFRVQDGAQVEVVAQKKGNQTLKELLAQKPASTPKEA